MSKYTLFSIRGICNSGGNTPEQIADMLNQQLEPLRKFFGFNEISVEPTDVNWFDPKGTKITVAELLEVGDSTWEEEATA